MVADLGGGPDYLGEVEKLAIRKAEGFGQKGRRICAPGRGDSGVASTGE